MGFLGNLRDWLFDFSAGQTEGTRVERMFRVALAETTSEAEFRSLCYRMIEEDDYLKTQVPWITLFGQLDDFIGAGETDWRIAVKRFIAFLPRFYGYKSDWETEP